MHYKIHYFKRKQLENSKTKNNDCCSMPVTGRKKDKAVITAASVCECGLRVHSATFRFPNPLILLTDLFSILKCFTFNPLTACSLLLQILVLFKLIPFNIKDILISNLPPLHRHSLPLFICLFLSVLLVYSSAALLCRESRDTV